MSEVIDLENGKSCSPLKEYPISAEGCSGALLLDSQPFICGGMVAVQYIKECYVLGNDTPRAYLHTEVGYSAAIALNESTLWVTGGWNKNGFHKETQLVDITSPGSVAKPGPDLPHAVNRHCLLSINSTTAFLVGGNGLLDKEYYSTTYFFNHVTNTWAEGPPLERFVRAAFGCGMIQNQRMRLVVIAGGYYGESSTEILDLNNLEWVKGTVFQHFGLLF